MRTHKKAFINKPFDIAAGFILAILSVIIIVTVYAITNNINVDDAIYELNAREDLVAYLSYEEGEHTVAHHIMHYPETKQEKKIEELTTQYFIKKYGGSWTIIITYPENYDLKHKDIIINKHRAKKVLSTTYLPLPEGGYAKIELFFPQSLLLIPIGGPGGFMPIIA